MPSGGAMVEKLTTLPIWLPWGIALVMTSAVVWMALR